MKTRGAYRKAAEQRGCVLECNGGGEAEQGGGEKAGKHSDKEAEITLLSSNSLTI